MIPRNGSAENNIYQIDIISKEKNNVLTKQVKLSPGANRIQSVFDNKYLVRISNNFESEELLEMVMSGHKEFFRLKPIKKIEGLGNDRTSKL